MPENADDARRILATVAHELGHACTSEEDFRRHDSGDSERTSEMCADHYAYKWGFGRWIARARPHRRLGHHGPAPRTVFTVQSPDGIVHRSRVTRAFRIKLIQTERPDGEVIETVDQIAARHRLETEEWEASHPEWAETEAALRASMRRVGARSRGKTAPARWRKGRRT